MNKAVFAGMALFIAMSTGADAQRMPELENGHWVIPDNAPASIQSGAAPVSEVNYVPAAVGSYEAEIYAACAYYGCDGAWLVNVMYCESGGDHGAVGPNGERGIFQYHPNGMWPDMAWAGPYEQIWHAAEQFANGYSSHWVCA